MSRCRMIQRHGGTQGPEEQQESTIEPQIRSETDPLGLSQDPEVNPLLYSEDFLKFTMIVDSRVAADFNSDIASAESFTEAVCFCQWRYGYRARFCRSW
jgi:hypothetical protein